MASLSQDLPETVLLSLLEADHKSFHKIARGGKRRKTTQVHSVFSISRPPPRVLVFTNQHHVELLLQCF